MRNILLFALAALGLFSCHDGPKAPDVSGIKIGLEIRRFEQDFFAMDTSDLKGSLQKLRQKYPGFAPDFMQNILGLKIDSLSQNNATRQEAIKLFLHDYRPVKDSSDLLFKNFDPYTQELKKIFQYVKYYFPDYTLPRSVITFIGPMDAFFQNSLGVQGDVLTAEGLGIGLQLHLGGDFSFYNSTIGQTLYPSFLSRNFDPAHITINAARNIADDLFEDKSLGKPLIEQMVEKGKFIYLVNQFIPAVEDYLLLGYSKVQMKAARENEGIIWSFFLNNELLNTQEQDIIKNYIGESPKTAEFGDNAPGNLGSFAGWQIVKKYMEKYPETSLPALMNMDPREIYSRAKYKPRN